MQLTINPFKYSQYIVSLKRLLPAFLRDKDYLNLQKVLEIPQDTFYFRGDNTLDVSETFKNELEMRMLRILCHQGTEKFEEMIAHLLRSINSEEAYAALWKIPDIIDAAYRIITLNEPDYALTMAIQTGFNARFSSNG